jgi:hypothetical protein
MKLFSSQLTIGLIIKLECSSTVGLSSLMFVSVAGGYISGESFRGSSTEVGSRPYLLPMDYSGKDCQGQAL